MISYVHPRRIRTVPAPVETAADAPTVQNAGSVRLRPGQEISLVGILAQREADARAAAARGNA